MAVPPLPSAARLPSLTGLRFLAAFAVFASHAYFTIWFDGVWEGNTPAMFALITARSGVGFFFLLSGFVLAWSARPGDTARSFWRRRAAKIYPVHAVTWFVALVMINWTGGQVAARQAVPNLLLVQSWTSTFDVYDSVNGVSWSLSCEAFFYLTFPLVIHLVRRIPARQLWDWAAGTALLVIALPLLATAAFSDEPKFAAFPVTLHQYWFVYIFPLTRLLEFVLGVLLACAVLEAKRVAVRFRHALPALAIGYALALQVPFLYAVSAVFVVPMALLVLAGAGADIRGSRSLVRRRPMVWLGDVSFAFYMVHMLVLTYVHRLIDDDHTASGPARAGLAVLYFGLALLAAWAVSVCVERPLTRRWGAAGPPKPEAGTPPRSDTSVAP
ncbi:acyltransferase family protein [Streptomyces boncukensis]|uniref:Acyltransferase n=1 Tax=Streptomyces boncukensis TaxID=2711219 RepID=A0A6G4X5U7_9ACTN|nr:acyltransferase [Streptomyces boncukensis]NGO72240.1 acyltransferase [Streptomyces boncukensis]